MKIHGCLGFALLLMLSIQRPATASLFDFSGTLDLHDAAGTLVSSESITGQLDLDFFGGTSAAQFDPALLFGVTAVFHDTRITIGPTGGMLVETLIDWNGNPDLAASWGWQPTAQPGGALLLAAVDGNGDGIPGFPVPSLGPKEGDFSLSAEGFATPVPLPAALILFGSGLLGLMSVHLRHLGSE